jgi:beta-glucosidase
MVMGISSALEGEATDTDLEGFSGGDRTDIRLPRAQEELMKEIQVLGKPVVLVLLNGSALAVNWADKNVPAILEVWYPGEEGGKAIADVLFGDYNPSGRLPVTFYKSVDQLPAFEDYSMKDRTYRYFKGEPLYPFGFGLSYSTFQYRSLHLSASKIRSDQKLDVTMDVQNIGERAGDEVVELYLTDLHSSVPVPIRALAGFKRLFLKPKESRHVSFLIEPRQLSVIDDQGRRIIEPGEFLISVGGRQPGPMRNARTQESNIVSRRFSVVGQATELSEK